MTTTIDPATDIRTRPCPSWCSGLDDAPDRAAFTSADHGVVHISSPIDSWVPSGAHRPIRVRIEGYRHDFPDRTPDWPDTVVVDGEIDAGCVPERLCLEPADLTRLIVALQQAAAAVQQEGAK